MYTDPLINESYIKFIIHWSYFTDFFFFKFLKIDEIPHFITKY